MHPYLGPTEKTPCETIGRPSSAITGSIKIDDGRFLENPSSEAQSQIYKHSKKKIGILTTEKGKK